jgi:transposase-like protein
MKEYSEAFKQQVVSEYESGRSVRALQSEYGIKGNGKWSGNGCAC